MRSYALFPWLTAVSCGSPSTHARPDVVVADRLDASDVLHTDVTARDVDPTGANFGRRCVFGGTTRCPEGTECVSNGVSAVYGFCARRCTHDRACHGSERCGWVGACLPACEHDAMCPLSFICAAASETSTERACVPAFGRNGRRRNAACFERTEGARYYAAPYRRDVFREPSRSVSRARPGSDFEAEGNLVRAPRTDAVALTYIAVPASSRGGGSFIGVSRSAEGTTWMTDGTLRETRFMNATDPVLDWGADDVLRAVFIGFERTPQRSHVRITESRDHGATFSPPVVIEPEGACATTFCDKPWLVSLPRTGATPTLLVAYTLGAPSYALVVQRSEDTRTWSPPIAVVPRQRGDRGSSLVHMAVGDEQTVYAAWMEAPDPEGNANVAQETQGSLQVRVMSAISRNAGRVWSEAVQVSRVDEPVVREQPWVAVDGAHVHVTYVRGDPSLAWDVVLATSLDAGATWRHRVVNDDPEPCATHLLPALAVDRVAHAAHVLWLENRFGDGAVVHARCPGDATQPCDANDLVSEVPFRLTTTRDPRVWHGDYQSVLIDQNGMLHALWSDTRDGAPHMYLARARLR